MPRGAVGDDFVVSQRDLRRVKSMRNAPEAQKMIPSDVEFLFSSKPEGPEGNEYYRLYLVEKEPKMTGH